MADILAVVHRLRTQARQDSHRALKEAEHERDRQNERLTTIVSGVQDARTGVDPSDPASVGAWQSWRLQAELLLRRETARLAQRERDLAGAQQRHGVTVRDELAIDKMRELLAEREAEVERRADNQRMDDIGARTRMAS